MGISGWTRLLAEKKGAFLIPERPSAAHRSPSLWMDMNQINNSGTVAAVGDQAATAVTRTCPGLNDRMVVIGDSPT